MSIYIAHRRKKTPLMRSNPCSNSAVIKNKMATLNEHVSVQAATLSDGSDTNVIYILLASECQQRNNEEHCKTNKTPNEMKSQLVYKQTLGSRD